MTDGTPSLFITSTIELAADRIAIGRDGDVIVAAGSDFSTIDPHGIVHAMPRAPLQPASPLSVAADGTVLAAPSKFDPRSGSWIAGVDSARPDGGDRLAAAAWTPDGAAIVTSIDGPHGSRVEIRSAFSVTQVERDAHWSLVSSLRCDERCCYGASVRLECWSLGTGERLWVTDEGRWQVTAMALVESSGESRIVTGRADGSVEQFDARSGVRLAEMHGDGSVVVIRPFGSGFVTADENGVVLHHDAAGSRHELHRFDGPIVDMDVTADAIVIAVAAWPPVVHLGHIDQD